MATYQEDMFNVFEKTYFDDALNLLAKYSWLYNFQLTHIFTEKVFENIPSEWAESLTALSNNELNQVPFGFHQVSWPESLKEFLHTAIRLTVPRSLNETPSFIDIDKDMRRGMNPKKLHEVKCIAGLIDSLCKKHGCEKIVDVGSGLGYLSLLLSHQLGYEVLGIECEQSRCQGADLRASKLSKDKLGNFSCIPVCLADDGDSREHFRNILYKHFSQVDGDETGVVSSSMEKDNKETHISKSICIIGLHSCGDLTATMLKLFAEMDEFCLFVTFSCCYHRMASKQDGIGEYNNFPLSQNLKDTYKETKSSHPGWCISSYALRLAAQETRARWKNQDPEQHQYHQNNVAFRGLLDLILSEADVQFHKDKRKLVHKHQYHDFDTYLNAVLDRHTIQGTSEKSKLETQLKELHDGHKKYFPLIEPLTCLQVVLQGVLESLILVDRITYLQEKGISAKLIPVMDDLISPRNMAIVSWK